ncbi:MAG: MipA/OmpV family protein [Burkholderiales bacterium]
MKLYPTSALRNGAIDCALVAVLALSLASPALADKPLWEAGIGIGAVTFPDYRGASHQTGYVVPAPYFVYRGEFFKADRNGLRGVLFDSDRVRLNMSLAASLPVSSDKSDARRGMPDLKPTIEFGPSLEINLWQSADSRRKLDLRLPARAAFTVERSPRYVGVIASPNLNLDLLDPFGARGWNLGLLAGPIFADRRQHGYFYDVAPRHATDARPEYRASGGYSGAQFISAVSKRFDKYWVGAFVRYDNLSGATFVASPLVEKKSAWAGGFAISWILGESATRVADDDRSR